MARAMVTCSGESARGRPPRRPRARAAASPAWVRSRMTSRSTSPLCCSLHNSEFERSLIRERQWEGIVLAKQRGAYRGRKKALSPDQVHDLLERVRAGVPKAAIARNFGIGRETLY